MCALAGVLAFVAAHLVAWAALGGGWPGAARAPFAVLVPALGIIVLHAVATDSYRDLPFTIGVFLSWQVLYLFLYVCARVAFRQAPEEDTLSRGKLKAR